MLKSAIIVKTAKNPNAEVDGRCGLLKRYQAALRPDLTRREQILRADTVEQLEAEVRALLTQLKISHITFFHRSLLKIPPQYAIGATF
ncbi:MAG: hypothetical protein ACRD11_10075 [Terriglobia bacterium]